MKEKLANGVGSQYPFTLNRNVVYPTLLPLLPLMRTTRLPVVDRTDAPDNINGLDLFAGRRNLVCARVPSHFKGSLLHFGLIMAVSTAETCRHALTKI